MLVVNGRHEQTLSVLLADAKPSDVVVANRSWTCVYGLIVEEDFRFARLEDVAYNQVTTIHTRKM